MWARVELYQDGGVAGPKATIETTDGFSVRDAISWAEAQVGHPWDGILVNVYEDFGEALHGPPDETYQIECRDGVWEVV